MTDNLTGDPIPTGDPAPTVAPATADGEVLPCGRPVDGVLEQVADDRADDRDAHQQGCPHCQAALAEYDRLWSPLRELAAEQVTAPVGFVDAAFRRIRGVLEHPGYGILPAHTGHGITHVAPRIVVVAARHAAQDVPGVRVALSSHSYADQAPNQAGDPTVAAGVAGASTAIEITLAADYGLDLHALGESVRHAVLTRVRELTGLEPVEVTVVIDDVLPHQTPPAGPAEHR